MMLLVSKVVLRWWRRYGDLLQLLHLEMERQVVLLTGGGGGGGAGISVAGGAGGSGIVANPIFRLINIKRIAIILNNYNLQSNIKMRHFAQLDDNNVVTQVIGEQR